MIQRSDTKVSGEWPDSPAGMRGRELAEDFDRFTKTPDCFLFAFRCPITLSRLAVWWIKLGIVVERIAAGHPEQNGRHERMHRTLKQETAMPAANNQVEQKVSGMCPV